MEESVDGMDDDMLGVWQPQERRIQIRPGLHEQQRQQVLRHEWIHAVLWDTGLYNGLTRELEEQICDALATALVASSL